MNEFMKKALESAKTGIDNKEGGPFGACIVDKDNKIVSVGHNKVLKNNDPTAHAEIEAIRNACEILNTYDLTGCTIYTTCEPCPMCLSACVWANIKTIYYGCTQNDADKIGFRDADIYEYLKGNNKDLLKTININRDNCLEIFNEYNNTIY